MEMIGINVSFLFAQLLPAALLIGLPIVSLIDLSKKKLSGAPLALWALLICAVPLLGALAYWIIKPTADAKQ
jgi:4-amino-4-deoxy-L-arabinose transferase-like glycosyltransferase